MSTSYLEQWTVIIILLEAICFPGERCHSLDGKWYSHLGLQLRLNHSEEGLIFGHYTTALEREFGSHSTADAQLDIIGNSSDFNHLPTGCI